MRYDAPRAVRIGDNSLNFAQAHLTLAHLYIFCLKNKNLSISNIKRFSQIKKIFPLTYPILKSYVTLN